MTFSYGGQSVYASTQNTEETTIGLDPVRLVQVKRTSTTGQGERFRALEL